MHFVYAITSKDFKPNDLMPKRRCPYCKELINYNAIKCKHCKSNIKPLAKSTLEKYDRLYRKRLNRRRVFTKILLIIMVIFIALTFYYLYTIEKKAGFR